MISPHQRRRAIRGSLRTSFSSVVLMVALVGLLLVVFGCPASAQTGPVAAIVLGNVADMVSTELALQRPGLREMNPVLGQSRTQRLILKSASTAVQVWMVRKIGRTHPKTARILGYSAGAVLSGIAVHNFRVAQ